MSASKATHLDASALVKLAVREPESAALRRYLRRHPATHSSSGADLAWIVTYDDRMAAAAGQLGWTVARPI